MKDIAQEQFPLLYELLKGKTIQCWKWGTTDTYTGQFYAILEHIDAGFTLKNVVKTVYDKGDNSQEVEYWPSCTIFSMSHGSSSNYKSNRIMMDGKRIIIEAIAFNRFDKNVPERTETLMIDILGPAFEEPK